MVKKMQKHVIRQSKHVIRQDIVTKESKYDIRLMAPKIIKGVVYLI